MSMFPLLQAVHRIARANGRDWKDKLACAWATGRYWQLKGITSNSDPVCGLLQSVRNHPQYGPGSKFWETVRAKPSSLVWKDEDGTFEQGTEV